MPSQFGLDVDAILVKPASQWTGEESNKIYKLMAEHGRSSMKEALETVRAEFVATELGQ